MPEVGVGTCLEKKQGSSIVTTGGRDERIEWATERPVIRGGQWGLGCSVCAQAVDKTVRGGVRRGSKWARFSVRSASLQASPFAQHAGWQSHELALELCLARETPVREVIADSAVLSEQELLKGSVPQPADWLRAWRYLKEGTSFRMASKVCSTETYIASTVAGPSRRAVKALQEVIVEQIREGKRNWLKKAVSIAILVDDRGAYKLIRFRCDYGTTFKMGVCWAWRTGTVVVA